MSAFEEDRQPQVIVPVDQVTPNKVIEDVDTRRLLTSVLGAISIAAGVAALFLSFFPEAAFGTDVPLRAIGFANALVSMVAGTYNIAVIRPNIPTKE